MILKDSLTKVPGVIKLYRFLQAYFPDQGVGGFHGDKVFQRLVEEIISSLLITSFVETGTYMGDSTAYVASRWNNLQIFSCEINDDFFALSKHRLKRFRNVELSLASSEEFIMNLVENKRLGNLPLFFLDAHWHDYWPLVDEIAAISSSRSTAIVIVDDFEVPGRPEFSYCVGGGSESFSGRTVIDQRVCGLDLIKPKMIRSNTYNALFPSYTRENAFPGGTGTLTGHIVIFQNLKDGFELFKRREFISQNYEHFSILLE